ncbi:hypothetical protein HYG86_13965 [Alkalicella caledoniensis]|uniref:Uncharacterized protein n=1 Tax=Alkalicella caledoniensis TaxID=2731377 RepID=A0A7G9WAS8_ALKCA|nr:hypothetical protein [Alkalicella caledoniensis]QNO15790.1 hypothetical protein HYG86_13965 [Alkalicella caledoniensis]
MLKLLKDLGVGTIFLRFFLARVHYIGLIFLFARIIFAEGFPTTLDRLLIFYIIGAFIYRYYSIRRQSIIIKRLMKLRTETKSDIDSEKVCNE